MTVKLEQEGRTDMDDDAALVCAALIHPDAFGSLYERYRDRIYRYLLTYTHNVEDADDLTQQVFLRTLRSLDQYRSQKGPFATWLFTIAHNRAINFKVRRRQTITLEFVSNAFDIVSPEDNPEAHIIRQEAVAHLLTLFARLEPQKRELLALRFVAGLTMSEIAKVIGKSEAATKKQLTRTLSTLKEFYHDDAR